MVNLVNNKKKGQIFLFDGIVAITLIIIALGVIFTFYYTKTDNTNIYAINQQMMNAYSKTKINQLNDVEIRQFFRSGQITNIQNTIAQQTAEFYYTGKTDLAINLTRIFIDDFITRQMNAQITLENSTHSQTLFEKQNRNIPLNKATITSVTKRSVIGFLDTDSIYGPYTLKILIWQ